MTKRKYKRYSLAEKEAYYLGLSQQINAHFKDKDLSHLKDQKCLDSLVNGRYAGTKKLDDIYKGKKDDSYK